MSKSRMGKAGLASLAVTGLVSSGLLFTAGTATAVPGFEFDRIAGSDRFATSALVAEQIGDGANAILANGQVGQFADALAANYLAGDLDAPVYLTRQNATPESILNQLEANEVDNITVVGGTGAVSADQVDALEADGYEVNRVSGANRFETNAEIINEVGDAPEDTALVATGLNFADALAGGPLAEIGHPLGLASRNGVSDAVLDALTDAGVDSAIVVGGENAVGAGAVDDLEDAGIDVVTRLAGDGRADTSVEVAEYGVANLGLTDTAVNLASGDAEGSGADALSGGVLTGQDGRPLLITQSVNNPSNAVRDYIEENSDTLTEGTIFGGNNAVSAATQAELEELGQGDGEPPVDPPGEFENITVTPGESARVENGDTRTYTASDLDPTLEYRITLVDTRNITENSEGTVFADRDNNNVADPNRDVANGDVVDSRITVVNGQVQNPPVQTVGDVDPAADGDIDFTVQADASTGFEEFTPVVYVDGGQTTFLDLDADNRPVEDFGLGGSVQVTPDEAPGGPFGPELVQFVEKDANFFATFGPNGQNQDRSYDYDSNDTYLVDGVPSSFAAFELELSTGDSVTGNYAPDPANVSTFNLTDASPEQPGAPIVEETDATSALLTLTDALGNDIPSDSESTWTVYGESNRVGDPAPDAPDTDSTVLEVATADARPGNAFPGYQVELEGLAADTQYNVAVTETVDGDESEISPSTLFSTNQTQTAVTIDDATLEVDALLTGVAGTGDQYRLVFSEPIDSFEGDAQIFGDEIRLRSADGAEFIIECVDAAGNAGNMNTAASCEDDNIGDQGNLDITLLEAPVRTNGGGTNPPALDQFSYPLEILSVTLQGANNNNLVVDVDGSTDTTIDDEG